MNLYAMVDQTGRVIGLVEWDGEGELPAFTLALAHGAQIGWTYGSGLFTDTQK